MKIEDLFEVALGLQKPWTLDQVEFREDSNGRQLHLEIGHAKGSRFEFEGHLYPVYDHQKRTWRHLNFFEHECYLHASVPRIKLDNGQVVLVQVPWADAGSSFTLLFEAYAAFLVQGGMPCKGAGNYMNINGRRVWRILKKMVNQALSEQSLEQVVQLGVDETSSKKGHNYLTILTDTQSKKVVGVSEGKDIEAFMRATFQMEARGSIGEKVKLVTMDMSRAYISAVTQQMPKAKIVFDRFHLEQSMNKVVDQVRREESKKYKDLKKTRYLWLKNQSKLSSKQQLQVNDLADAYPNIGQTYRLKELFKQTLNEACHSNQTDGIKQWIDLAWKSGIDPVRKFVETIAKHWYGIKTYFKFYVNNGFAERVNLKIQEIKRTAKGYRNLDNFICMIYFHLGKLDFNLPTKYG